jgi:DNA polymerase III alpha subunit (gram-positive type)
VKRDMLVVSVDIETDGPAPMVNSMLSMGAAAYLWRPGRHEQVDTFTVNLTPLPGAVQNAHTMKWWRSQPAEVWAAATDNAIEPAAGMTDFVRWLDGLPGPSPTFAAYPAGFDFTFVYTYLHAFVGHSPFSHSALDMKTLASSLLGVPYRKVSKRNMAVQWPAPGRHTHVALDDAIEQGEMLMQMLDQQHSRNQPVSR